MNVMHVSRRFAASHWGGTETTILEVCKRLRRDGHQTWVAAPNALAREPREQMQGVTIHRYPYFYPYLGLRPEARQALDLSGGNMFSFRLLDALMHWPHIDLIHLHTARRTGAIGRYVARKRRVPYVLSLHGGLYDVPATESANKRHPAAGCLEWGKVLGWWVGSRRVVDDASAILCVGRGEMRALSARHPRARAVHLPNGVDVNRFATGDGARFRRQHAIPEGAPLVLTVGRIHPQKDQQLLLRILPALRRAHGDVRVAIVGHVTDEACLRGLERLQAELPAESIRIIPGLCASGSDLVDAYHAADCFALPSRHEPFGIAILEAWAAGRPVVASRVGGVPDFVAHGVNGLLCAPGDEQAFTRAISLVLGSRTLAASMALAGWHKARVEYSWDRIVTRLESLYEEVLREHPLRA